jgi:FAD/FMN-containing dehydrogenase
VVPKKSPRRVEFRQRRSSSGEEAATTAPPCHDDPIIRKERPVTLTKPLADLLPDFTSSFSGRAVGPDHADYDNLRAVVMGGVDRRPALIVRPRTAADVARAIRLAADAGVALAVRSGGHSGAAHGSNDGGIVIDVRDLNGLEIDAAARTAWAGTGLTAGEVSAAVTGKGLAVGFGDAASVGIGGIVTGGGVGYLSRKHGLSIDAVLAAEVVTADGAVRLVDAQTDPELFWAIRGGGGNFGVVTKFRFRLAPLDAFTGGMLVLPATPATIDGFLAAAHAAPRELGTIMNVMPAPPMPFLKPEVVNTPIILAMLAFAGDDEAAQRALQPFRALATPLADFIKPGPYMQMFPPEDPGYKPVVTMKNTYLSAIEPGIGRTVLAELGKAGGMRVIQLRVLGGAIADVPADATAYAHRAYPAMAHIVAFVEDEADRTQKKAWIEDFAAALHPVPGAAYVNFVADEGEARVRDAYPEATFERLARIKARVDPANLFRLNQNVPPAA